MKSSTLQKLVISAVLLMAGVLGAQLYWLKKTFALEEEDFNVKVHSALNAVVQQIRISQKDFAPFIEAVHRPQLDYYTADIKYRINPDSIETMMKRAFEANDLYTSYQFGVHDGRTGKYLDVQTESFGPSKGPSDLIPFPAAGNKTDFLAVLFTNRKNYIISEMNFWIFSTGALILMIIALGLTIFILFRQKLLSEIQKDFINNMTHEFRTPISTIQLSADVLKNSEQLRSYPRLQNYSTIILNEAGHLEKQVEGVLQVAKMEKHAQHLKREPVDIHEVIGQTVQDFSQLISQKQGRFLLELKAENTLIRADALHITNILFNLVDNAIKYSPKPEVIISTYNDQKGIYISVEDQGVGIPGKYHKLLFSKFFRVPTGNIHEVKGFGLGLNYVKLYTRAFRGRVGVESEVGKGSIFTLYFPQKPF